VLHSEISEYIIVTQCFVVNRPGYGSNMEEIIEADYHHARRLGQEGGDCQQAYPTCPFGHGLLDLVSMVET
jgi:hypothetical protein